MPPADSAARKRMRADERFFVDTSRPGRSRQAACRAVNAVRKLGVSAPKARATVEVFASWQPIEAGFSAAEQAGCAWLLTEDFQVGRKLGRVTVVNPFQ